MKRSLVFMMVLVGGIFIWASPPLALIIESPKEGETLEIGQKFQWLIRPETGEECKSVNEGSIPFNSVTGRYEAMDRIDPDDSPGSLRLIILGESANKDADCSGTTVTLTVVLPPTTVLQGIEVDPRRRNLFLEPERFRTEEIGVLGFFSDGVERTVKGSRFGNTYQSSDEKIVTVDAEGVLHAVSIGTATITVKNGSLTAESIPVRVLQKIESK